jgi:hypothetical protein
LKALNPNTSKSAIVAVVALLLAASSGCKKEAAEEAPAPAPVAAAPAAEDAAAAPAAAAEPAAAPASTKNWDEVVAKIIRMRSVPLTDEKRSEVLALEDELVAAAGSDPKAKEAYQNMSRILTGR